jgi:hypothetical protein
MSGSSEPFSVVIRRTAKRIQKMSSQELLELCQRAGIIGPDKKLTPKYKPRAKEKS